MGWCGAAVPSGDVYQFVLYVWGCGYVVGSVGVGGGVVFGQWE